MGRTLFPKLEDRRRRERAEREGRSAELRRRFAERGIPVLRAYGVRQAWLFGSVAAGMADGSSDLDLLVIPAAAKDYWSLRRELEAAVGCSLDLYTQEDDPVFVRKIRERGELIDEIQPGAAESGR